MHLFVKLPDESTSTIEVNDQESISGLKEAICNIALIPACEMRLKSGAHSFLEDRMLIRDYDIRSGSTIFILNRLRGGMPKKVAYFYDGK